MPLDYVLLGGLVCIFNRNNGQNPRDDDAKSAIKPHRCIELYTVEKYYRDWFSLKNCQVEHLERLSIFANLFCWFKKCSVISSKIFLAHLQMNWWLPKTQTSEKPWTFGSDLNLRFLLHVLVWFHRP